MSELNFYDNASEVADLEVPQFNSQQLAFFKKLADLYLLDILDLTPEKESYEEYRLQYVSLKAMNSAMQYLITLHQNQREEERIERINQNSDIDHEALLRSFSDSEDNDSNDAIF